MLNARTLLVTLFGIVVVAASTIAGVGAVLYETIAEIRVAGNGGWIEGGKNYRAVASRDGFIYVLPEGDGLAVFDGRAIAESDGDVTILEPTCEIDLDSGQPIGLLAVRDRLYCYGWEGGEVFDVSDPGNPVRTGYFGDRETPVLQMVHHDGHLVAACHDRLVVYSLDVNADYPTVVADLAMESGSYVYSVCVVGERLCAAGSRKRRTGVNAYWLGAWDFSVPERTNLLRIVQTEERGYRLIPLDGMLLAVSENQTELWQVDDLAPALLELATVCGRAVACDGDVAVLDDVALKAVDCSLQIVGDVECPEDRCHTGFPCLGVATGGLVALPRSDSVAILRRVPEG